MFNAPLQKVAQGSKGIALATLTGLDLILPEFDASSYKVTGC